MKEAKIEMLKNRLREKGVADPTQEMVEVYYDFVKKILFYRAAIFLALLGLAGLVIYFGMR